jgi:hypothetical protein
VKDLPEAPLRSTGKRRPVAAPSTAEQFHQRQLAGLPARWRWRCMLFAPALRRLCIVDATAARARRARVEARTPWALPALCAPRASVHSSVHAVASRGQPRVAAHLQTLSMRHKGTVQVAQPFSGHGSGGVGAFVRRAICHRKCVGRCRRARRPTGRLRGLGALPGTGRWCGLEHRKEQAGPCEHDGGGYTRVAAVGCSLAAELRNEPGWGLGVWVGVSVRVGVSGRG